MARALLICVVVAALGCTASRPLPRPVTSVFMRPGAIVPVGRAKLTVTIKTERTVVDKSADARFISEMSRAGQTAIGRGGPPQYIPERPVTYDGAQLVAPLEERAELSLSEMGYVVAREPPFDVEIDLFIGDVRNYGDGWEADTARLKFRNAAGELLKSIEVSNEGSTEHPAVLLRWVFRAAGMPASQGGR